LATLERRAGELETEVAALRQRLARLEAALAAAQQQLTEAGCSSYDDSGRRRRELTPRGPAGPIAPAAGVNRDEATTQPRLENQLAKGSTLPLESGSQPRVERHLPHLDAWRGGKHECRRYSQPDGMGKRTRSYLRALDRVSPIALRKRAQCAFPQQPGFIGEAGHGLAEHCI